MIPANYTYPVYSRMFSTLNNPLVQLVYETSGALGRPIRVVDVGAAVGDTALLIARNCPTFLAETVCIDGDPEFCIYLQSNLRCLSSARAIIALLSRHEGGEKELVRIHGGTASAQGGTMVAAIPLDVLQERYAIGPVDLLKTDVDGFDGEVLAGATRMLQTQKPAVIFEWHPRLCSQTGKEAMASFSSLRQSGYRRILWFTKYGGFSHFGSSEDEGSLNRMRRHCLETTTDSDWHYDVIALHDDSRINEQRLADLAFATAKKSGC